jgi:hypothetical protein
MTACGKSFSDNDFVAAVSHGLFDAFPVSPFDSPSLFA